MSFGAGRLEGLEDVALEGISFEWSTFFFLSGTYPCFSDITHLISFSFFSYLNYNNIAKTLNIFCWRSMPGRLQSRVNQQPALVIRQKRSP